MARTGKTAKRSMGGKKVTYSKARKVVGKMKKKQASKNMDTFALKVKTYATITPTQGVSVSNFVSFFAPLLSQTASTSVVGNAEFNLYNTMYDQVRVNSMKITITPKANVLDMREAQNDTQLNVSGDGLIHHCIDRDDQPPASIARIMRYPSYRKTSLLRKFSRFYSVKYPTSVWLDCQSIFGDTTLLSRLGLSGGIYLYGENILEDSGELFNEPWATISIEYNCVFRGKTSANLSFDSQTGVVSVTPTAPSQIVANSPVTILYGSHVGQSVDNATAPITRYDGDTP